MPSPPLHHAFPPAPKFTEKDLVDQYGRVFIVTGAAVGVGFQLAKILYSKNGTVYIATRSEEKIKAAIATIRSEIPVSAGRLEPLILDLADLPSIKPAAMKFLAKEQRLDVLVHNAGVMRPPKGSTSKQGHDLEMATNCLGPFLLTHFLQDILRRTARNPDNKPDSVRTVWTSSFIQGAKPGGGMSFDARGNVETQPDSMENYLQSKSGSVYLAHEWGQRLGSDGIVNMSVNPGLTKTELQRHLPAVVRITMGLVFKPPIYGAYSELVPGWSPEITSKHNGGFMVAWGRHETLPDNLLKGIKTKEQGGFGVSRKFWDWCVKETSPYF